LTAAAAAQKDSRQDKGIGFTLSAQADAKDVGLPIYPGARPHKDESNEDPALQMGAWGTSSGFKLVVLKMESNDNPGKVAAFYRKALSKYGPVLDCSQAGNESGQSQKDKALDCGDDHPKPGGVELKSGTKEQQHVVGIEPNGAGTIFALVYVESHGDN
jgi:hypothetical protein